MATHTGSPLILTINFDALIAPSWFAAPVTYNQSGTALLAAVYAGGAARTRHQPITPQIPVAYSGVHGHAFSDDFYNHMLIDPNPMDIGNLVGNQSRTLTIFNGYFTTRTLEGIAVGGDTGTSISGPAFPLTLAPLEEVSYTVLVNTVGPPTIDGTLSLDFDGTADDTVVAVLGTRIVIMPYRANATVTESLEWMTDIMPARDGVEQRVRVRTNPRQSFSYVYPIPPGQTQSAMNLVYGWLTRKWAIPVWQDVQLVGPVTTGDDTIICDTTNHDFRVGSLILLWSSATVNEAIEVSGIAPGLLTLTRPVGATYASATLVPVRTGIIKAGSAQRLTTGYSNLVNIVFLVTDNLDLAFLAPTYPQYLGYDLCFDDQLINDTGLTDTISGRVDMVDYDSGVFESFTPWLHNQLGRSYDVLHHTVEDQWNFRLWLMRRCGSLRAFWAPTFEADFRLAISGLISNSFTVYSDNYGTLSAGRSHLAVLMTNGTWVPVAVLSTADLGGGMTSVGIDTNLGVDASQIEYISFLGLKRLASDTIDLKFDSATLSASPQILEIQP